MPDSGEFDRSFGLDHVVEALETRFLRNENDAWLFRRLAQPAELRQIELHAISLNDLIVDQSGVEHAYGEAIGPRGIDYVGADDVARAGNILHHDLRTLGRWI